MVRTLLLLLHHFFQVAPGNTASACIQLASPRLLFRFSMKTVGIAVILCTFAVILCGCHEPGGGRGAGTPGVNPIDNAPMVWVPWGTFTMGSASDIGYSDEHNAHSVTLSGFWIYQYEVTVAQYRTFCTATSRALPSFPAGYSWAGKTDWTDATLQRHPMVNVTWADAKAYAAWAGVSLPTEAQWEYAARGRSDDNYPWGGAATTDNLYVGWDQSKCANYFNSYQANISTWPVGSFPKGASWCAAQDLAGNVWEWCSDWYGYGYSMSSYTNPTGPSTGDYRVLRGGSWYGISGNRGSCRCACRLAGEPANGGFDIGFRCVSRTPGP